MPRRKTTEEFINDAIKIHENRYDYSLVNYVGYFGNVRIICDKHGIFKQSPANHLKGKGCPICGSKKQRESKRSTIKKFIKGAINVHGNKYDYSKSNYIDAHTKIKIMCPEHGLFEQIPNNHLCGKGCVKCSGKYSPTTKEFIERAIKIHGDIYDYSEVNYINYKTKVKIFCNQHNDFFEQTPYIHLNGHGCSFCCQSKGEFKIVNILNKMGINYIREKTFENCKYKKSLHFDFYLSDYNICIEYDGEHHFICNKYFGGEKALKKTQIRDKIKNDYCKNNNITLYRICYNENIEDKMNIMLREYLLFK